MFLTNVYKGIGGAGKSVRSNSGKKTKSRGHYVSGKGDVLPLTAVPKYGGNVEKGGTCERTYGHTRVSVISQTKQAYKEYQFSGGNRPRFCCHNADLIQVEIDSIHPIRP